MSFHGNTLGTLSLAYHPIRRAPYADILDDVHFHHVSPAYAKRFQRADENEEQYVERLRQELEDKFLQLGPDTVIGCMVLPLKFCLDLQAFRSCCRDSCGSYHRCRISS
jgi:adenosylmethionine-8-amino-7-oxononanoate aminotransferase